MIDGLQKGTKFKMGYQTIEVVDEAFDVVRKKKCIIYLHKMTDEFKGYLKIRTEDDFYCEIMLEDCWEIVS